MNLDAVLSLRPVPAPVVLSDGTELGSIRARKLLTEHDVVSLLQRDDFVSVAVVILYARQLPDERASAFTRYDNGVGFNKYDAERGTYYGEWVTGRSVRFKDRTPCFELGGQRLFLLSGGHLQKARHLLHKYRKQIANAINAM